MHASPTVSHAFNYVCQILHCNKSAELYQLILYRKVKSPQNRRKPYPVLGILLNQNDKSIELPNLKLIFATEPDKTEEIILTPQQYLVENLRGIQRIPSNTLSDSNLS